MARNNNRSEAPRNRPDFVVLAYHTDNPKERPTEVGTLWPRKDGQPGYMLSIKRGLSLSTPQGVRMVCLPIDDKKADS